MPQCEPRYLDEDKSHYATFSNMNVKPSYGVSI